MTTTAAPTQADSGHADPVVTGFMGYLADNAARRSDAAPAWAYRSYEQLVLDLGGRAQAAVPEILPGMRAGTKQLCFFNAAQAAAMNPDLVYVEGFAQASFLPVKHAWCVHVPTGQIVDPAWIHLTGLNGPAVYLGVRATNTFLAQLETPDTPASLIAGDWRRDFPALKHGFVFDAAGCATGYATP